MKISSLQKGLVLHVPLSQERYNPATKRMDDLTPNSNHGTSANAANFTTDRMGQSDRAMSFNGTSDYVDCRNDASLTSNNVTVSTWLYSNTNDVLEKTSALERSGDAFRLAYSHNLGSISYRFAIKKPDTTIIYPWLSFGITGVGSWHMYTVTYNGEIIKIYRDGVYVSQYSQTGVPVAFYVHSSEFYISSISRPFNGSVADTRIYNRAISQEEITALYEQYDSKVMI